MEKPKENSQNQNNYTLYTDGAYSSTRNQMGIALVYLKNGELLFKYKQMVSGGTNNKAELMAVIIGLRLIKDKINSLVICTDSQYVIGCGTLGWKRNKNIYLWKLFDIEWNRVKGLCNELCFEHVKGHSKGESENEKWNNIVDKLAVQASQEYDSE